MLPSLDRDRSAIQRINGKRLEFARLMANTNPPPLPRFRGNGPLSNMAEFAQAFACKKGDTMVRAQVCKIW